MAIINQSVRRRVVRLTYRDPSNLDGIGHKTCYGDDEARSFARDREVTSVTIRDEVRLAGPALDLYLIKGADDESDQLVPEEAPDPRVPGARLVKWHARSTHPGRCGGLDGHGCGVYFRANEEVGLVFLPDREHGAWYHLRCAERVTGQVADRTWPHDAATRF